MSTPVTESKHIPEIITEAFLDMLRDAGIVEAKLFGSFADGTETAESDIDLLVKFGRPISLLEKIGVADDLSAHCGRRVDLLTSIHPYFQPYIEPTLIPLPL